MVTIFPTIHRNGTSKVELLDGVCEANTKIHAAILAMQQCTPNARDYYVQKDGNFKTAVSEHQLRIHALRSAYEEMEQIAMNICDQES